LEVLRQCLPKDLPSTLEKLPKSLDETYRHILKEINNASQKDAHRLLQCLAVAHRPLRVEELADVLALDVDDGGIPRFNAKWRWEDHEAAVLSACSILVSVIIDDGSQVVQFSHFSVKEFLTSDRLASMKDVSQFHIFNEPSHEMLAQACLGVLLSVDDHTSKDSVENIALLPYADRYCGQHFQVGKVELRIKDALDCLFDLDKPHFEAFFHRIGVGRELRSFRAPSDEDPRGVLTPAGPLFVACVMGLSGLAERLMVPNQPQVIGCRFQGWTLLHWVVRCEHIEVVRLLLANGADINSRPDCATPPYIASLQSHVERLMDSSLDEIDGIENILWNRNADMSSEESIGDEIGYGKESDFTPLHIAVSEGYLDMCQMLLEHHADVRAHDDSRNTSLHLAASKDHLEIARTLLKYNAEVNSWNENGSTPLLIALSGGNIDISRLLLAHNAHALVYDNKGNTPLHLAAICHLEVARSLLECKADVNALDNEGLTPLQRASEGQREGYLEIMRLLLDHGANVIVHDKRRNTPLHFAASEGHLEVAHMLLERKVNVNALDDSGSTPLHQASHNSWRGDPYIVQLVQLLLDNGADIHTHDNYGNIPLHFAASSGHLEVARMLLEHKADVNALNKEGSTPLHQAFKGLRGTNPDIVRLLLDHGADANMHDKSGNTLLHFATSNGDLELARILLERIPDVVNSQNDDGSTAFLLALARQNPDIAWLLLDHNPDVHTRDKHDYTPLHFAVRNGHLAICRILLERNVEVNSRNHNGSTPLLYASEYGTPDLVQLLLEHNADVHVRDADGDTLLHCAAIEGQLEVARLLFRLKVDVNAGNNKGSTPLHIASAGHMWFMEGNVDMVRLFLNHGADVQVQNLSGETASEVARGPYRQEIVQLLSQHAAQRSDVYF
jgi:ankyrin repeat protein